MAPFSLIFDYFVDCLQLFTVMKFNKIYKVYPFNDCIGLVVGVVRCTFTGSTRTYAKSDQNKQTKKFKKTKKLKNIMM